MDWMALPMETLWDDVIWEVNRSLGLISKACTACTKVGLENGDTENLVWEKQQQRKSTTFIFLKGFGQSSLVNAPGIAASLKLTPRVLKYFVFFLVYVMCMCAQGHVEARDECWGSFLITLHFVFLRLGLSLNLELSDSARLANQKTLGTSRLHLPALGSQVHEAVPSFFCRCWGLDSDPHASAERLYWLSYLPSLWKSWFWQFLTVHLFFFFYGHCIFPGTLACHSKMLLKISYFNFTQMYNF